MPIKHYPSFLPYFERCPNALQTERLTDSIHIQFNPQDVSSSMPALLSIAFTSFHIPIDVAIAVAVITSIALVASSGRVASATIDFGVAIIGTALVLTPAMPLDVVLAAVSAVSAVIALIHPAAGFVYAILVLTNALG